MKLFYKPTFFCILIQFTCSNFYIYFILRSDNCTNIYCAYIFTIRYIFINIFTIGTCIALFSFLKIILRTCKNTYISYALILFFFFLLLNDVLQTKLSTVRIFFTLTVQTLSKCAVKSKQCSSTVIAISRS